MSGSISTGVPSSILNPGFYYTLTSNANNASPTNRVVILGDVATGTVNVPVIATSVVAMNAMFGATSTLATMYARYRETDAINEVWLLPVAVAETVPAVAAALAGLASMSVAIYISAFSDSASITALDTFLTARWGYVEQLFGFAFAAMSDTVAHIVTFAGTQNSEFVSVLGVTGSTDSAPLIAAAYGAAAALSLSTDPELTLTDIALDFAAPALADQYTFTTRETMLEAGISTFTVDDSGDVVLSRAVTLYTHDSLGNPDTSYQDVETLTGLSYVIQKFRTMYALKLTRKKVVSDDTLVIGGTNFVTPVTVLALFIAEYKTLERAGMVQNSDIFARNARSALSGGTINLYLPIQLANQLRTVDVAFAFSK